jgi:hypothetical protein
MNIRVSIIIDDKIGTAINVHEDSLEEVLSERVSNMIRKEIIKNEIQL